MEVASNDDAGGRQSQVAFPPTVGAVYYIAVDGWRGSVGNIVLHLTLEETYTPRVEKADPGLVISNPVGISCGGDCQQDYVSGAVVTLTATPSGGVTFAGWGGACSGGNLTCQVTMNQARSVTAAFNQQVAYSLKITKHGNGSGVVRRSAAGVNCGGDYTQNYTSGVKVKLTWD